MNSGLLLFIIDHIIIINVFIDHHIIGIHNNFVWDRDTEPNGAIPPYSRELDAKIFFYTWYQMEYTYHAVSVIMMNNVILYYEPHGICPLALEHELEHFLGWPVECYHNYYNLSGIQPIGEASNFLNLYKLSLSEIYENYTGMCHIIMLLELSAFEMDGYTIGEHSLALRDIEYSSPTYFDLLGKLIRKKICIPEEYKESYDTHIPLGDL